jgi:hypothetical protein
MAEALQQGMPPEGADEAAPPPQEHHP